MSKATGETPDINGVEWRGTSFDDLGRPYRPIARAPSLRETPCLRVDSAVANALGLGR